MAMTVCSDETACVATHKDEHVAWQEEKQQWIKAAGVNTPADLEVKIADLGKVSVRNGVDVKSLVCNLLEVKELLMEYRERRKEAMKKKRCRVPTRTKKSCQGSAMTRKRSRRECLSGEGSVNMEESCTRVESDTSNSSSNRAAELGRGSLLDPNIMRNFRSLVETAGAQ